jgi:nitroimidazol reductase NimA-like FMN-containing flavoprotein (pyridoxamine 5'-phosphate oxidase superfamily)
MPPTPSHAGPATERTRVKRLPDRGKYDRDTVYAILDAGLVCHVGYNIDGHPFVTPTACWREGDHLYWHGSSASRMLRAQAGGIPVCVTVTHLDGLVLARSGFHHSLNYRAVMALGNAELVESADEKRSAMQRFVERVVPGRWEITRQPTVQELKATSVLRLALNEASAKVRTGPPIDDDADYLLPVWAGVIPVTLALGSPQPDPRLADQMLMPPNVDSIRLIR